MSFSCSCKLRGSSISDARDALHPHENNKKSRAMAATEVPGQTQSCQITSNQAAKAAIVEFKVVDSEIVEYTYGGTGRQVSAKKLQVMLVSQKTNAYCLGTARMRRNDEQEL